MSTGNRITTETPDAVTTPADLLQKIVDLQPVFGFDPSTLPRAVLRAVWSGMDALRREEALLDCLQKRNLERHSEID